MKKYAAAVSALLIILFLLSACAETPFEPDYYTVAVDGAIAGKVSPFYAECEGDLLALSLVCLTPMEKDEHGEWKDRCGHIEWEENDAGNIVATVTLSGKYRFSDNKKQTIDDLIFMYYIFCDPCYTGTYSNWHTLGVAGADAYYYDDPDWSGELPDFASEAQRSYTPGKIDEGDLLFYFVTSEIDGKWNGIDGLREDGRTWREFLIDEGESDAVEAVEGDGERALAVAAAVYAEKYSDDFDYTSWWEKRLEYNYIHSRLDKIDVKQISGITRVDDYTCTVEFDSSDADVMAALNVPIASKANYSSSMPKGNGDYVASSGQRAITVGAGPFYIDETEDGAIALRKNKYAREKSDIPGIAIRRIDSSDIITNVCLKSAAIGKAEGIIGEIEREAEEKALSVKALGEGGAVVYREDFFDCSRIPEYDDYALFIANIWRAKIK